MKQKGVVNTSKSNARSTPLVYRALLTQSGTDAPVATVLENTLGTVVWSRNAVGIYNATCPNAFQSERTSTFSTCCRATGDALGFAEGSRFSENVFQLTTYVASDLTKVEDEVLDNVMFCIYVS